MKKGELRQRKHRDTKKAKAEVEALIQDTDDDRDESEKINTPVDDPSSAIPAAGAPLSSRSARSGYSEGSRRGSISAAGENAAIEGADEAGDAGGNDGGANDDDGNSADDNDDDDDDPSSIYAELRKPFVVPPHLAAIPPQDDTLLFAAAVGGLTIAIIVGALLPKYAGVPQRNIMVSGLGGLLIYALNLAFCGCCRKQASQLSPIEMITPSMVFTFTACIGTMLGGMIVRNLMDEPCASVLNVPSLVYASMSCGVVASDTLVQRLPYSHTAGWRFDQF